MCSAGRLLSMLEVREERVQLLSALVIMLIIMYLHCVAQFSHGGCEASLAQELECYLNTHWTRGRAFLVKTANSVH